MLEKQFVPAKEDVVNAVRRVMGLAQS